MTTDEIKRIISTLGTGEHSYYVYALCVESVPFYIGKGHKGRILNHRDAALLAKETIEADNTLSPEERELRIGQMSEKIQTILNNKEQIEEVIIKWGLTEQEALMCESSLINILGFCRGKVIPQLTNIVNGHASSAEKESVADIKTKARSTASFLQECAIVPRDIAGLAYKIAFIKINSTYLDCIDINGKPDDDKIKDSVRGFWKIAESRRSQIQYIFALYKGRVVGIYHITSVSREMGKLDGKMRDFPRYPLESRKNDYMVARFASIHEARENLSDGEYRNFITALTRKNKTHQEVLDAWRTRVFFTVDDNVPKELQRFKNSMITKNNSSQFVSGQSPVVYNF